VQVERFETTAKTLTVALANSYSYGEAMSDYTTDLYIETTLEQAVENYCSHNKDAEYSEKLAEVEEYKKVDQLDFIEDWIHATY
jgi:hypothetical protein